MARTWEQHYYAPASAQARHDDIPSQSGAAHDNATNFFLTQYAARFSPSDNTASTDPAGTISVLVDGQQASHSSKRRHLVNILLGRQPTSTPSDFLARMPSTMA